MKKEKMSNHKIDTGNLSAFMCIKLGGACAIKQQLVQNV
jgi:hypothetical protein